ncbi:ABC transporter permease [Neobacillus mesonae]|uniref:ABC transporter permease n=1 Tax=Neobacillus mesonae TaxID=1193713 RepID=UPI000830D488|nr:ABC transporter permease subunit [Neobacillus mesonae]
MSTFIVLAKKEVAQMVREYKIIWLPLVFIFLGITQPVVTYYLPDILKAVGGGQGITIDPSMAAQNGGEVLASTLGSQFDQLGIMIIIVSIMGIIQSDKANGMLAFILTRPVKVSSYIYGKIISNYLFVTFSVTIGYLVSYLYVYLLFTSIHFIDFLAALLFYLLWVLFIVSFTTMISTIFNSQGIIALISIVFLLVCRVIVGLSPVIDRINPASMSKYGMDILVLGTVNPDVIWGLISTILLSALTLMAANKWISKKKYSNE